MMTRRHFESIAGIINRIPSKLDNEHYEYDDVVIIEKTRKLIANELADYFMEENPQFNRKRFLDKCDLDLGDEE